MKGRVGTGAADDLGKLPGVGFPSDTRLLFPQASAPTGWTQDTDANDRVIRVIDDTGTGAATGGNWTLSGMSVDDHTLTINEMPSHTHGPGSYHISKQAGSGGPAPQADGSGSNQTMNVLGNSGPTGGGDPNDHGLTNTDWRPAYLDVIKTSKD